jgi:hypothetical protein
MKSFKTCQLYQLFPSGTPHYHTSGPISPGGWDLTLGLCPSDPSSELDGEILRAWAA